MCCPENLPSQYYEPFENSEEEEVFMIIDKYEPPTNPLTLINPNHYQDIIITLEPTLSEHYNLTPYQDIEFTSNGIHYNRMYCTWYYIKYISQRLTQNFGRHAWTRDWKGPAAQCWCGDKLYSPSDEYIKY